MGGMIRLIPAFLIIIMTLFQARDNFLKIDILEIHRDILNEDGRDVADIVREQLLSGVDGSGNKITPEYRSTLYAVQKNRRNPNPGLFTPDLKDTGDFHSKIFYDPNTDGIDSSDWKRDDLVYKYGHEILEIGDRIESYRPKYRGKFTDKVVNILES